MIQDKKIALLIDAENITSKYGAIIFREVAKYGTATYRRIYGDFVNSRNINWTQADFSKFSLTPVQQYSYTVGKNSSDITMVIDAMDILYSGNVDMFCIVTSDSDYTKLVTRLREAGLSIIGMGETKTPRALKAACEKFIPLDSIFKTENKTAEKKSAKTDSKQVKTEKTADKSDKTDEVKEKPARGRKVKEEPKTDKGETENESEPDTATPIEDIIATICNTILPDLETDSGWANLADVGNRLTKLYSDFDPRTYGYDKLSRLVRARDEFEVDKKPSENHTSIYYVRIADNYRKKQQ